MENDRVKKIKGMLADLTQKLTAEEHATNIPDYQDALSDYINKLKNCSGSFDAKKYFVVCIGAAKSGKSTLLNALAGREVSPAGAGAETTMHCSVIMAADEAHPEGITVYKLSKPVCLNQVESGSSEENNATSNDAKLEKSTDKLEKSTDKLEKSTNNLEGSTKKLVEYFQGSKEWDKSKNDFEYKKIGSLNGRDLSPNETNLEYVLTSHDLEKIAPFQSYLLAEIRVKVPLTKNKEKDEENILNKDVALIDMPGLDGTQAGVKNNPELKYLPKKCHHLFLVHSSVSALNQTTKQQLQELLTYKGHDVPFYSIYNKFDSSPWHNDEDCKNEGEKQIKKARNEIKGAINASNVEDFSINAAKAVEAGQPDKYSSKWREGVTPDSLYKESDIKNLKDSLLKKVQEQKETIILKDALNDAWNLNKKESRELLTKVKINAQSKLDEIERKESNWNGFINDLESVIAEYQSPHRLKIIDETISDVFKKILDGCQEDNIRGWKKELEDISNDVPWEYGLDENITKEQQKEWIDTSLKSISKQVSNIIKGCQIRIECVEKLRNLVFKSLIDAIQNDNKLNWNKNDIYKAISGNSTIPKDVDGKEKTINHEDIAKLLITEDKIENSFSYNSPNKYFEGKEMTYNVADLREGLLNNLKPRWLGNRNKYEMESHIDHLIQTYVKDLQKQLRNEICNAYKTKIQEKYETILEDDIVKKIKNKKDEWEKSEEKNKEKHTKIKKFIEGIFKDVQDIADEAEAEKKRF